MNKEMEKIIDRLLDVALSVFPFFVLFAVTLWIFSIALKILIGPIDESDGTNEMEEIYRENPHLRRK